jgi:hypothetical protein
MEIRGLDTSEIPLGLDFKQLPNNGKAMYDFAVANNLLLYLVEGSGQGAGTTTTLKGSTTALNISTTTCPNATVGLAESVVLTCANFAGTGQGDHLLISNVAGERFSIWMDKDGNGTEPTGPLHVAADHKIKVAIVTGDSAIAIAGKIKTAVELDANWLGFATITNGGDGTLTIACSSVGNVTDAVRKNTGESGNGSFTIAITQGIDPVAYSKQIVTVGGNGKISFAVTVGALPTGLALGTDGLITGIDTHVGLVSFSITATDAFGATDTQALTITGVTGA